MPKLKLLRPPRHLSREAAQWWADVVAVYMLEGHHLKLLSMAAETFDRYAAARDRLNAEGVTVEGREGGMRPHPCIAIERDARSAFAALVKQLALDDVGEPKRSPGRPPQPIGITSTWRDQ